MSYLVLSCFNTFLPLHILHVPPRKLPHRRQESSWGTYCGPDPSGKPQPCSTPHWGSKRCVCLGRASPLCTTWVMAKDFYELTVQFYLTYNMYNLITFSLIVEGIFRSALINLWAIKNHRYIVPYLKIKGDAAMVKGKNIGSCLGDLFSVNWMEDPGDGHIDHIMDSDMCAMCALCLRKWSYDELCLSMFYLFIDVDRLHTHTHNTHTQCVCLCSIVFCAF